MKQNIAILRYLLSLILFLPMEAVVAGIAGLPIIVPLYFQSETALKVLAILGDICIVAVAFAAIPCLTDSDIGEMFVTVSFQLAFFGVGFLMLILGGLAYAAYAVIVHPFMYGKDFVDDVSYAVSEKFDCTLVTGAMCALACLSGIVFVIIHIVYLSGMMSVAIDGNAALLDVVDLRTPARIDGLISIICLGAFAVWTWDDYQESGDELET